MKDHEIRELVTALTEIAKDYADTQQLRGRISECVLNKLRATEVAANEIERLRYMLNKARDGLSCGLWDYGEGQSEHDQCDELLAEIDAILLPNV